MKGFLTFIFTIYVLFLVFMATPFGMGWALKDLEEGKPCYGILIAFGASIPMLFVGAYLGIFK